MTDLTTQMRDYLDSISSQITDDEIIGHPVAAPVPPRSSRRGPLIALVAFVTVLVILGTTILFLNGGGGDPDVSGPVETATLEELDAVVRPAIDALLEAPGFVVAQEAFFNGQLGDSVWVTSRPGGDFVSLTARDLSVLSSASSATSGIEISARAYVDGVLYQAGTTPEDETPWFEVEEAQVPDDPQIPIGVPFPDGLYPATPSELENEQTEATRQRLSNGGIRLTAKRSSDTSEFIITEYWEIHPDGHLAEYSFETNQTSDPEFPVPSLARLSFRLLTESNPISAPAVGTPLDLTKYDIPQDLDLLRG